MRNSVYLLLLFAGLYVSLMDGFLFGWICKHDRDCFDHHCHHDQSNYCQDGKCHCKDNVVTTTDSPITTTVNVVTTTAAESVTHSVASTTIVCINDFDCTSHVDVCPNEARFPYCRIRISHHGWLLSHETGRCDCIACLSNNDCTCPAGKTPHCEHTPDDVHQRTCRCSQTTNFTTTVQTITMTQISERKTSTSSSETTSSTRSVPSASTSSHNNPPTFAGMRKCHTCGDANSSISCDTRTIYLGNLQNCAPDEHFCMTDIVHDGSDNPKTFKRCVTEEECRNKWLHQTSDLEYCINYGNVPMTGQYSCHFCCVTDGCNAGQVPDKSTYYTKA